MLKRILRICVFIVLLGFSNAYSYEKPENWKLLSKSEIDLWHRINSVEEQLGINQHAVIHWNDKVLILRKLTSGLDVEECSLSEVRKKLKENGYREPFIQPIR